MEAFVLWHRTAPTAHDEDVDWAAEHAFIAHVRARIESAGATIVGPLGGSLAAIFRGDDLVKALETALALLDEAEKSPEFSHSPRITLGGALGEIETKPAKDGGGVAFLGGAIDRAQLLANRARAGELVLDGRARTFASSTFLFSRAIGTGEPSLRGHAIDREEPRVDRCRRNLAHLGRAPTPTRISDVFVPLRELARRRGTTTVVIRGPAGSGARRCVAEVEFATRPSLALRCTEVPGGLEPLGSLRSALVRAFGSGAAKVARVEGLGLESADVLGRIARGEETTDDVAYTALVDLLTTPRADDAARPWVVVEPVHGIDESTLELVGRLSTDARVDALVLVHARPDTVLPPSLERGADRHTISVPTLEPGDARAMVAAMLREPPSGEIARRVSASSADTPLAVVECLRTYLATGDVVRRGRSFVFRIGPRPIDESTCVDWVRERLDLLDGPSHRLLELLALVPPNLTRAEFEGLAATDGISSTDFDRALTRLRDDRLVVVAPILELDHILVREAVLSALPSPRRAEIAALIAPLLVGKPGFARATLGHYLLEAGSNSEAATVLLDAAESAAVAGHPRAAIRLAASAVEAVPTPATRGRATAILRGVTIRIPVVSADRGSERTSIEVPAESVESPAEVAVAAFRRRDFDRIDRIVDLAIAEGASLAAADRWRALVALLRGDTAGAETSFARSRERANGSGGTRSRTELAIALQELQAGRPEEALRTALLALADERDRGATDAEPAIGRVLSLCFRALGRDSDAAELTAALAIR